MKTGTLMAAGLAAAFGLANLALAAEEGESEGASEPQAAENHNSSRSNVATKAAPGAGKEGETPAPTKNFNSSKSNTSTSVGTTGGDDKVQGSGDPLKGLNVCKNFPTGKCPGEIERPGDDAREMQKPEKDEEGDR